MADMVMFIVVMISAAFTGFAWRCSLSGGPVGICRVVNADGGNPLSQIEVSKIDFGFTGHALNGQIFCENGTSDRRTP